MAQRISKTLMEDLISRDITSFSILARILREEIAHMSREQLGRAMGYQPSTAYAIVQQIEDRRKTAGIVSVRNYLSYFSGLDIPYVARLVGQDRAHYLLNQLQQ